MAEKRLKGQEVSIRVIDNGRVVSQLTAISSFNDNIQLETQKSEFLGESRARFDEIADGFSGDFEYHTFKSTHDELADHILAKADRRQPDLVFNVVTTEFYPNGDTAIYTYLDVAWGPIGKSVTSRKEYVKIRMQFECSERKVLRNSLP